MQSTTNSRLGESFEFGFGMSMYAVCEVRYASDILIDFRDLGNVVDDVVPLVIDESTHGAGTGLHFSTKVITYQ